MDKISLHLRIFNEKIKVMNQTNGKSLILPALEARNLHNDIFLLLAQIAELNQSKSGNEIVGSLDFDGGTF